MVNTIYENISFDHFVLFQNEAAIFSVGRTQDGHLRIFLIFENGRGRVYSRNGREDSWEEVDAGSAHAIRNRIREVYKQVPTYTIGSASPAVFA